MTLVSEQLNYAHLIQDIDLAADATTIVFTSIPNLWRDLLVVGVVRTDRPSVDSDSLRMRMGNGSLDTGNNYSFHRFYTGSSSNTANSGGTDEIACGIIPATTAAANNFAIVRLFIGGYTSTDHYTPVHGNVFFSADTLRYYSEFGGNWENTSVVDTVGFHSDNAADFIAGSNVRLYGLG